MLEALRNIRTVTKKTPQLLETSKQLEVPHPQPPSDASAPKAPATEGLCEHGGVVFFGACDFVVQSLVFNAAIRCSLY